MFRWLTPEHPDECTATKEKTGSDEIFLMFKMTLFRFRLLLFKIGNYSQANQNVMKNCSRDTENMEWCKAPTRINQSIEYNFPHR